MLIKEVIKENLLATTLLVSVLVHTAFFLTTFSHHPIKPEPRPLEERLEIVLVTGGNHQRPDNAPVLAQIDSEGSGTSPDEVRKASPIKPNTQVLVSPTLTQQKQQLAQLEAQNKLLYTQLKNQLVTVATAQPTATSATVPDTPQVHAIPLQLSQDFAEIDKRYQEYQRRPKKTQITPNTARAEYALYYKMVQAKIERVGTINFPQKNGQKLYGTLLIYIPIYQDGTIYDKEGGVKIKRSSGNSALDAAAVRIVNMAAPFSELPANMRQKNTFIGGEVWEIISTFDFTNQERLQTLLRE